MALVRQMLFLNVHNRYNYTCFYSLALSIWVVIFSIFPKQLRGLRLVRDHFYTIMQGIFRVLCVLLEGRKLTSSLQNFNSQKSIHIVTGNKNQIFTTFTGLPESYIRVSTYPWTCKEKKNSAKPSTYLF